ncbi:bile acid:sodium symporter family protein [Thalassolituus alkanivorans]|uniref:bile acid:sodium symporter family protein n=1 Tax=Thalassolituus alkanivorans TaxID=2881055 RepID=UPI001E491C25|nr:AEC family transporter [Thalassolituus alkanivorans]MCB2385167.1 bile acid:sodium symporter family protein [Thalassolituus alkanivorans]MCB2421976.1 bile acid:sodium symporter family protein [Thalassolituus alkanivorans]
MLTQVALPLALAMMMLVMGLSLRPVHFIAVAREPKLILLGLALQLLLLPALALMLVMMLSLPATLAIGLIILVACPGGATSNIISHLSGGDASLSVTLTALITLLAPLTLPLWVNTQLHWLSLDQLELYLPWLPTLMPLLLVTVVPLLLGMVLAARYPQPVLRALPWFNRLSLLLFIILVIAMAVANSERLPQLWSQATLVCLGLCVLAMAATALISRLLRLSERHTLTLMIEVGIQNAGTAMLISATILQRPDLALVALFYGILMNIPALLLIGRRVLRQPASVVMPAGGSSL